MGIYCAFDFTGRRKDGYTPVLYDKLNGAPRYDGSVGYGFVSHTCALPAREVHPERITSDGSGFYISEPSFFAQSGLEQEHYNHYGMVFRIKAAPGAYEVCVRTATAVEDAMISLSGMHAGRLLEGGHWDAACKVPVRHTARASGREWSYRFATGQSFIDVELEPARVDCPIGLEEIVVRPIAPRERPEEALPAVFILGDSTVKSYTFSEAPTCGWGQVIDGMFDPNLVHIVNYSMGGRSFKNAYFEGRFNDILLTGSVGDYILFQFGHNDERLDEHVRYGRGSTEEMYKTYLRDVYLSAVRARGMIPVLVTPMSRIQAYAKPGDTFTNSFTNRKFPDILRALGAELEITVIDLNAASLHYYNEIGVEATTALYMSIEAGETPGKTNDGSFANGHPQNKIDGTHFKEAMARQFARMIVTVLDTSGGKGDRAAAEIASFLKKEVKAAVRSGDWSAMFPQMAEDTTVGTGSYYRNQIEKMLQLGAMTKDDSGRFHPETVMTVREFAAAVGMLLKVGVASCQEYEEEGSLTREVMAALLYDAYQARFRQAPRYMTDYNGRTLGPDDPGYDPNLDAGAQGITYYPIVTYDRMTDLLDISPIFADKVKAAYELGLIRSENGIARGVVANGDRLEPKMIVTRAKAAKALYFMWVLAQPVQVENHTVGRSVIMPIRIMKKFTLFWKDAE